MNPAQVSVAETHTIVIEIPNQAVQIIEIGQAGPQGIQGVKGTGGDLTYQLAFNEIIGNVLYVNHGLAKYPNVTIIDSAQDIIEGDIEYIDSNNVKITVSGSFAGVVICN
jgi:hypothetical protein